MHILTETNKTKETNLKNCLVFGSINLDFFFYVKNLPNPGETIIGSSFETFPGGKGFNQAFYINQFCPKQTRFLAFIGNDLNGSLLRRKYIERDFKNNDDLIKLSGFQSGCAFITVNEEGENTIVVNPGSNMNIETSMLLKREEMFKSLDFVVSQCEIPLEIIELGFSLSKKNNSNVKNILNLSPIPQTDFLFILKNVDILIINEVEFHQICKIGNFNTLEQLANTYDLEYIICTRGIKSVLIYDKVKNIKNEVNSFKAKYVVDTCGAGDSFLGGFVAGLMKNVNILKAVEIANKVASKKIKHKGAQVLIKDIHSFF